MIIIDNSLDIKIDIVKNLLNNKKTFYIMINNEFIYNYIMKLLYQDVDIYRFLTTVSLCY